MERKEFLSDLYQKSFHSLRTLSDWENFWKFQGQLYKYDFTNSLLLWRQSPEVTQVADLSVWNRFGRRVPKGTKSLFTWDISEEKMGYVFDIKSTYAVKDISIRQWEADEAEIKEKIRQGFLEKYSQMEKHLASAAPISLEDAVKYAIFQSVKERDTALLAEIKEQLKMEEPEALEETLNYIAYMTYAARVAVSARLNLDLSTPADTEAERYFNLVKEKGFLELTGNYISDAIEDVLREAEGSVKEYDRERKERSEENRRRKRDRIYRERRWASLSEYRPGGGRREDRHRAGQDVAGIYEGEIPGPSGGTPDPGRTGRYDEVDRQGSLGDHIRRGESLSGEPSDHSGGLHRLGHEDAGRQELRHGADGERVPLPVSLEITSAEIEEVLAAGSLFTNGKYRIYDFFQAHSEPKERAAFLKKEYGIGGWSGGRVKGVSGADWDGKGIKIKKAEKERFLTWTQAAAITGRLITEGRFFTEKEKANLWSHREETIIKQLEREKAYWDYKKAHKLFLFGKEYEIQEVKESLVMLREAAFPLNTLELTKEEMEKEAVLYAQNDESWITEEEKLLQEGEGEAWVRVLWSEGNIPKQSLFSFSVADALFARLDGERVAEKQREDFDGYPYDKTRFEITARLLDGEIVTYGGRQDFGDGDGSLYEHIEKELSGAGLTGETKEKTAQLLQVLKASKGSTEERQNEKATPGTFRIYQLK